MDYYPFYIGALFGFGAGFWFAYFLFRMPQIRGARKAAKTRRLNKIKEYARKRASNPVFGHTFDSAIAYYQKFSPEMFTDIADKDLKKLIAEESKQ